VDLLLQTKIKAAESLGIVFLYYSTIAVVLEEHNFILDSN